MLGSVLCTVFCNYIMQWRGRVNSTCCTITLLTICFVPISPDQADANQSNFFSVLSQSPVKASHSGEDSTEGSAVLMPGALPPLEGM